MREKIYRFMQGRYGFDQLSRVMVILAFIFMILTSFLRISLLDIIGWILLILAYFRMLSRNIPKRYQENQKYLQISGSFKSKAKHFLPVILISDFFAGLKDKNHKIYRCPSCHQRVRVPKGRGKIAITCPKCHTEFIRKS